jgi:hypothetical protein
MKKTTVLLVAIILCSISTTRAQLKRRSLMAIGSVSYNISTGTDPLSYAPDSPYITLKASSNASVGMLFTKHFAMGLDVAFDYGHYKIEGDGTSPAKVIETARILTPGVFARWNFFLSQKVLLFVDGGYGYGFLTDTHAEYWDDNLSNESKTTSKTNTVHLKAGLNWFITKNIAFECTPGVVTWSKPRPGDTMPGFDINVGLRNLTFGVACFFGGVGE